MYADSGGGITKSPLRIRYGDSVGDAIQQPFAISARFCLARILPLRAEMSSSNPPVSRRRFCAGACQAVSRQGFSFFGEARIGATGWAGLGRVDFFNPDADKENDNERRYIIGGAHWSQLPHGRVGFVATLEQKFRIGNGGGQETESRLLVQTHLEF